MEYEALALPAPHSREDNITPPQRPPQLDKERLIRS